MHNAHIGGLVVVAPLTKSFEQILLIVNGLLAIKEIIKRIKGMINQNFKKRNKKRHAKISVSEVNYEINDDVLNSKNIQHKAVQISKEIFSLLDSLNNIELLILLIGSNLGLSGLVVAYDEK